MKTYSVKEAFYSIQGEGANVGRPAVFCRFAGCNLWTGREEDRASAVCAFCDTDFVGVDGIGGGQFRSPESLGAHLASLWPSGDRGEKFVVLTGGEPCLQVDPDLTDALHAAGFSIAIETNGTLPVPTGVDWICVSPKAGTDLKQLSGDELKLVFPQENCTPEDFERLDFRHFFLQPMDGPRLAENTKLALEYCLRRPKWRLSLQVHKFLGVR